MSQKRDQCHSHATPFPTHISLQEALKLKVDDEIDHRDKYGQFCYATIIEKKGTNLKIHYDGWSAIWDKWSDFNTELYRFAKAGSISRRPAHRFSDLIDGDHVRISPTQTSHAGWRLGCIKKNESEIWTNFS